MAPIKMEESDASMRARLVESLCQSFPGSALSRALHGPNAPNDSDSEFSDCDLELNDPLSASCFSEIHLDKVKLDPDDEELTSLSWLQDGDLLKNLSSGDRALCSSPLDDIKENDDTTTLGQPHPPHVPYNPQKHVNSKPPYSFSCLIFMAIEDSPMKKLPVKDIYHWILSHFPYFQNAPTGWKNSVRHNLSLNKCFKKVEKEKGMGIGKGSLWCIDPDFRPNLLQALRKTPYHPYHQLQMLSHVTSQSQSSPSSNQGLNSRLNANAPSPHLFPFLSRRLAQSKSDTVATDDIDVANTLVSLKRAAESRRPLQCRNGWGSRGRRSPSPPEFGSEQEKIQLRERLRISQPLSSVVVTRLPSDDHTYSISEKQLKQLMAPPGSSQKSPSSSIDEEYEFGSDSDSSTRAIDSDDEVESDGGLGRSHGSDLAAPFKLRLVLKNKKAQDEKEGAEALLNLAAGFTSDNNNIIKEKDQGTEEQEPMDES